MNDNIYAANTMEWIMEDSYWKYTSEVLNLSVLTIMKTNNIHRPGMHAESKLSLGKK